MEINKLRKEITQLIDNIKEHSDYLSDFERIPQVEIEMIMLKIKKLHEKAIIFNHEYEQEMLSRRIRKEAPPMASSQEGIPGKDMAKNEAKAFISQNDGEKPSEYHAKPPEIKESPKATVAAVTDIEKLLFEEDKPEKKTEAKIPKEGNLVEDKPEEKLVREAPGTHIHENPMKREENAFPGKEKGVEKGSKAELHEKLKAGENKGSLNERIGQSKIYSSLSNKLQMNPISDLNKAMGINEKFLFTKEMFNNNSPAFSEALNKLNNFSNYAQAEHYLYVELAPKYNWDRTSDTFSKFMELVQRRYL